MFTPFPCAAIKRYEPVSNCSFHWQRIHPEVEYPRSLGSSRPPFWEGDASTYLAFGPWRVRPDGLGETIDSLPGPGLDGGRVSVTHTVRPPATLYASALCIYVCH